MPIRLFFLLIFLPSTFLSSLNVSHVDALNLYEPKPLGWNNVFFQGSQERDVFVRLLYAFKTSDSPSDEVALAQEKSSALFPPRPFTGPGSEKQVNTPPDQKTSFLTLAQPSEIEHLAFSLRKRKFTTDQPENSTPDLDETNSLNANEQSTSKKRNFIQETPATPSESINYLEDNNNSPSTRGKNETSPTVIPPKTASKATQSGKLDKNSKPESLDAGMKGAIAIGAASILLSLMLILRKIFIAKPTEQNVETNAGTLNNTNNYVGSFTISGPIESVQKWNDDVRLDPRSNSQKKFKAAALVKTPSQAMRPAVLRTSEKPISLPSNVKLKMERTRLPVPRQSRRGS